MDGIYYLNLKYTVCYYDNGSRKHNSQGSLIIFIMTKAYYIHYTNKIITKEEKKVTWNKYL